MHTGAKHMWAAIAVLALVLMVPSAALAGVSLPKIKRDCGLCHTLNKQGTMITLRLPMSQLCLECHPERKTVDHVFDVKPTMKVRYLPLDREGRMTCATCHEPHGLSKEIKMLRGRPSELCNYCHRK